VLALDLYESAVARSPATPLFLGASARAAREAGRPERALAPLRRLERMNVLDPAGQAALIAALAQTGDVTGAVTVAASALARNPYDALALEAWRAALARAGDVEGEHELVDRLRELERDPYRRAASLRVVFDPPQPTLHIREPRRVGGQTIHDHSQFRTTLHNPSRRAVELDSAMLFSLGTGSRSGLGDIATRFLYETPGSREIPPDGTVDLDQHIFGFTVDTAHVQLSYVFVLCWHGLPSEPKQCAAQHLDLLPPLDELP
jgi:hypothetical protein